MCYLILYGIEGTIQYWILLHLFSLKITAICILYQQSSTGTKSHKSGINFHSLCCQTEVHFKHSAMCDIFSKMLCDWWVWDHKPPPWHQTKPRRFGSTVYRLVQYYICKVLDKLTKLHTQICPKVPFKIIWLQQYSTVVLKRGIWHSVESDFLYLCKFLLIFGIITLQLIP